MQKKIFYTAFVAIAAGSIFASCETKEKKVEEAAQNVQEAKQELKEAKQALNAEYPVYRTDMDVRITQNDKRIARLREEVKMPGERPLDGARRKKIEELKERNAQLRSRLYGYETERSDWVIFKRDYERDMNRMDESFKEY